MAPPASEVDVEVDGSAILEEVREGGQVVAGCKLNWMRDRSESPARTAFSILPSREPPRLALAESCALTSPEIHDFVRHLPSCPNRNKSTTR